MENENSICKCWHDVLSSTSLDIKDKVFKWKPCFRIFWKGGTRLIFCSNFMLYFSKSIPLNIPNPFYQKFSFALRQGCITKSSHMFWCISHFPFKYFIVQNWIAFHLPLGQRVELKWAVIKTHWRWLQTCI